MLKAIGMSKIKSAITGAAPIQREMLEFYRDLGLTIMEVYGQSEDNGPTTFNTQSCNKLGSAGPPFPGVELKIAEDGEILVRSPHVFVGYLKVPIPL